MRTIFHLTKQHLGIILLFLCFCASRVIFVTTQPVFFDSQEYIDRFSNSNFFQAIDSGHIPLHTGYIILFWPIYHFAKTIHIDPLYSIIICQIILSFFTIFCFFKFITQIANKSIGIVSALIASLLPLFWITSVTIMMENAYISFFIFSLFFLGFYLKKNQTIYLFLSVSCFGFAFLTHLIVLLWLPLYLYTVFFCKKSYLVKVSSFLLISIVIASVINGYFVSLLIQKDIFSGIIRLYTDKLRERAIFSWTYYAILRYSRNIFIPLLRNNTNLIVLLSLSALFFLYKKNKGVFLFGLLWIIPAVIANQWWDSLFLGRHSLIACFGFSFLVSYFIIKKRILLTIVCLYLLLVSIPALKLLNGTIPYIEEAKVAQKLPHNGLLIESHFARPQVDKKYHGKTIFVEEPGWEREKMVKEIKQLISENRPVFVTSQALSEPYGLYSGPYLHTLSLSYYKDVTLRPLMAGFTMKTDRMINKKDNLIIYQIIQDKSSTYPKVAFLKYSKRRIDYFDPISQLWFLINQYVFKNAI